MSPLMRSPFAMLLLWSACAAAGSSAPAPSDADGAQKPDATITISGGVVALGVGYEWARGTLTYQGRTIPFWIDGLSVVDIGAAKLAGTGQVFNLKSLDDFAGPYAGSTFGSAVAHGTSLALLKNENGVTVRIRSSVSGVRFNFSGNGMHIRLSTPPKHEAPASAQTP